MSTTESQLAGEPYTSRSAVEVGATGAAVGGAGGLLLSSVKNSLQTHKHGALGIFTRTGHHIATLAAVAGAFAYTDAFVANQQEEDTYLNAAAGGCVAGIILGASRRSLPFAAGSCLGLSALLGSFNAAGSSLRGRWAHASPLDSAAMGGSEQHGDHGAAAGSFGWREERERRRAHFFKPKEEAQ
ncbi:NADH-UBIQUINONE OXIDOREDUCTASE SUBUNIT [Ceraceosorus bombacis]|uniref:NADH-UBIQUINONE OXIDOREDUCTASE SUBUNIT n=1 Tax=Ceraceosorus bombacis TaxID=401625 RepID=A0A0P1BA10_9BASI|nr:NADH-UBIQUINONE OXIDOREDUCTASE SUBUNIT [Ceraceosorus bombacis]